MRFRLWGAQMPDCRAESKLTRSAISLLVMLGLSLSSCAPRAGAPGASLPAPAGNPLSVPSDGQPWQVGWEQLLASARREGRVVVNGPTGAGYREAIMEFQKAYPEISLELTTSGGRDFAPRVLAERRGGVYLWDVLIGGAGTPAQTLKPEGVLIPFDSNLLLPSVTDDSNWFGGFKAGFYDVEQTHVYAFSGSVGFGVYVNRDRIPESELSKIEDLVNPRWRGRIISDDVQAFGSGCGWGAHFLQVLGEDWLRRLFAQDLTISSEKRQRVEWLVQGRYPIGIAIDEAYLDQMQREGLGKNVKPLAPESDAGARISQQSGALSLISNAPNPNAAMVFANWLLSYEAQTAWSRASQENSRRLDVTEGPVWSRADPTRQYRGDVAREDLLYLPNECVRIGKEVIK